MPTSTNPTPKAPMAPLTPPAPLAIASVIDETFKRLDLDLNGSITMAEVMKSLAPVAGKGAGPLVGMVASMALARLDTNKDGAVTRGEFKALLDRLDADHSGTLTFGEIQKSGVELIGLLGLPGLHHPMGG